MNYKIIKELGFGVFGTTYLIETTDNKKYAMKIQKIFEKDIKNKNARVWNEIKFAKFTEKYPEQFVTLKEWNVVHDCKHQQKIPSHAKLGTFQETHDLMQKSNVCLRLIYELRDGDLGKINIIKFPLKKIYSLLIQLTHIVYLLSIGNWIHKDLHFGNIMYKKVPNKTTIKVFGKDLNTYGFIYSAIDYGNLHDKTSGNRECKIYNDLPLVLNNFMMVREYEMKKHISEEKFRSLTPWNDLYKKILKEPIYETHIFPYLVDKKYSGSNMTITLGIFSLLDEDRFYYLLGIQKVLPNYKKYLPQKWFIPKDVLLYMFQNISNLKKIIMFLFDRLEQ
jgi:serine/threonine protein kinase